MKNICVFCSSSDAISQKYFDIATGLGEIMAKNNFDLVYGGAGVGLMKKVSDAVKNNGQKVIGVIPEAIQNKRIGNEYLDTLIVTKTMHERKQKMYELSDAFIALPGGFGTLEELLEIMTLKQLEYHKKPIVIYNLDGFFDNILKQFDVFYDESFSKPVYKKIYHLSDNIEDTFDYLKNYKYEIIDSKWFDVSKKAFE